MEATLELLQREIGTAFKSKTGALAVCKAVTMAASESCEISISIPKRFIS